MSTINLYANDTERFKWYHGVLFYIAIHILAAPWIQTPEYVNSQIRAPFSPPNWAFGPVWLTVTVFMTWAGLLLVNKTESTENRQPLLILQAITWICFLTFGWFYFGLHSPILGAVVTLTMLGVTVASVILGFGMDIRFVYALIPLLIWLVLASAVSVFQMLYNIDELFNIGPFIS